MPDLEEIKIAIREETHKAVSAAIDEKVKDFYIDREKHWNQHLALEEFIEFWKTSKKTMWRTLLSAIILGVFGLFWLGWKLTK